MCKDFFLVVFSLTHLEPLLCFLPVVVVTLRNLEELGRTSVNRQKYVFW